MASSISTGSAASTPDPQAMTAVVQPTMPSKATPPAFKLSHQSRDTASHLGSATDTKLNLDDFQLEAWLAVDLEPPNSCNSDRLLNHMLSLRVPDGLGIDNDLLLDRCLKGVLPIRHLEEVINYIKTYCAETSSNAGRDRYAPNDPSLDNVAVRAVAGVHHNMPNDCDLAPIIGLSWYDGIERTGTLSFLGINLCHADSWVGLITRLYRHELEGKIFVLPWIHLQCDDDNHFQSHAELQPWTGALKAAQSAKKALYSNWHELVPYASWKSEWTLAFYLCEMLHLAHEARSRITQNNWKNPRLHPKLEDVEKSTEQVYDEFWAVVKQFYNDDGDMDGYKALTEELRLPVDA